MGLSNLPYETNDAFTQYTKRPWGGRRVAHMTGLPSTHSASALPGSPLTPARRTSSAARVGYRPLRSKGEPTRAAPEQAPPRPMPGVAPCRRVALLMVVAQPEPRRVECCSHLSRIRDVVMCVADRQDEHKVIYAVFGVHVPGIVHHVAAVNQRVVPDTCGPRGGAARIGIASLTLPQGYPVRCSVVLVPLATVHVEGRVSLLHREGPTRGRAKGTSSNEVSACSATPR